VAIREIARLVPAAAGEALWAVLTTEPGTGVAVYSQSGLILYANDQWIQMLPGEGVEANSIIGSRLGDIMPEEWTTERLEVLRQIQRTMRPALVRTIWRGWQLLSWIHPIGKVGDEDSVFLAITRPGESSSMVGARDDGNYERVNSSVANLGPLGVLSDREIEVLALLSQGLAISDIANILHRSPHTIVSHRKSIGDKLGLDDRVKLSRLAARAGLQPEDSAKRRVDSKRAKD
jgi:DNA-binding CsgD family transcriptional regulator